MKITVVCVVLSPHEKGSLDWMDEGTGIPVDINSCPRSSMVKSRIMSSLHVFQFFYFLIFFFFKLVKRIGIGESDHVQLQESECDDLCSGHRPGLCPCVISVGHEGSGIWQGSLPPLGNHGPV